MADRTSSPNGVDMLAYAWVGLGLSALLAGACLVSLMVVSMRLFFYWATASALTTFASLTALLAIAVGESSVESGLLAAIFGSAAFVTGYTLASLLLPRLAETHTPASLTHAGSDRDGAAVIVAAAAEPESYDPIALATLLADYDETGVPLPARPARPMIFAAERARYRLAFSFSPARSSLRAMAERLREELDGPDVSVSWYQSVSRLDHAVARAVEEGAGRIAVLQLGVAETRWSEMARETVEALVPDGLGVHIGFTPPLWAVDTIGERLADRIVEATGDTRLEEVGIALVGHGQPDPWDALSPSSREQETYFRQRIRMLLTERGISEGNVRLAWLDWQEPDVTDAIRHLGALGSTRILVVPVAMPAETLDTLVDLRQAARHARLAEDIEVVFLDAWGADDTIIGALADVVRDVFGKMSAPATGSP